MELTQSEIRRIINEEGDELKANLIAVRTRSHYMRVPQSVSGVLRGTKKKNKRKNSS